MKPSGMGTTLKKTANESFHSKLWFLFSLLTAALISLACKVTQSTDQISQGYREIMTTKHSIN